ncbi:hypothetical protein KIW84_062881 [Lathyrus oleraceus]|uniref:VPS37 C-terminal domain-containing protein n=1 Tax=Pisum sativum TaxID=3888 RepID=A0A9D5A629_PEA|nr:hypothetical protein KIW84_062881 [Pisum sativum]
MFKFWGSQDQQSVMNSSSSSSPATPVSSSGSPRPSSHIPPAEAAGTIVSLKDKSVDAYQQFLQSLDQVKIQNNLKDELSKENLQLAEENLQKEPRIMGLRNQCRIIQTTELATASEKLNELEKQKEEMLKLNSPASLLQRIQESVHWTYEESENLHQQLLVKKRNSVKWLLTFIEKIVQHHLWKKQQQLSGRKLDAGRGHDLRIKPPSTASLQIEKLPQTQNLEQGLRSLPFVMTTGDTSTPNFVPTAMSLTRINKTCLAKYEKSQACCRTKTDLLDAHKPVLDLIPSKNIEITRQNHTKAISFLSH